LTLFFLVVLAAAWIAVFFPSVRRATQSSPYPSTRAFKRSMSSVSPMGTPGGLVITPGTARAHATQLAFARKQRRRQNIFIALLALAAFTLMIALGAGRGWLELHLAVDGVLLGYVAWLIENRNRRVERVRKVHRIRPVSNPSYFEYEVDTGT
jgi:hypothetical protein